MVNPRLDRAVYRQVADLLRARIESGGLTPGEMLPSESDVIQRYGVSRTTVRLAVGILRSEGLVVTEHGRGTFVRHRPAVRRRAIGPQPEAGAPHDPEDAGARTAPPSPDLGASWDVEGITVTVETDEAPAPQDVADLLVVETGTPLLRRRFVLSVDGLPHQISTSYLPRDLVAGTPVADPAQDAWPGGTPAQLASLGIAVTAVEESVLARMPTPEESDALDLTPGVPVLAVVRRMLAGDRPVEVSAPILVASDRVVLDYRVDL